MYIQLNYESDKVNKDLYTKEQVGDIVDPVFVRDEITRDLQSPEKKRMQQGVDYYNEKHKILNATANEIEIDGKKQIIPNASNFKIIHNLHTKLLDQKRDYLTSKGVLFTYDEAITDDQKNFLKQHLGKYFNKSIRSLVLGSGNKSVEWLHYFIDEDGHFDSVVVPAEQVIAFYDGKYDRFLSMIIRYYKVEITNVETGVKKKINRAEVWTEKDVTYYIETAGGTYVKDPEEPVNPRPHGIKGDFLENEDKTEMLEDEIFSWLKVPFIPLYNNPAKKTDLQPIKSLIDLYDILISTGANTIIDIQEAIWEVKGAEGEKASQLLEKLLKYKLINVEGEAGAGIKGHQLDIPWDARKDLLEKTKESIYEQGRGVNMSQDKLGNSPSGISLEFLYNDLDTKCNEVELSLDELIEEFLIALTSYYNMNNEDKIDYELISWTIPRSRVIDGSDGALSEVAAKSKGIISDETIVENHPWSKKDPEREMNRLKEEAKQKAEITNFEFE